MKKAIVVAINNEYVFTLGTLLLSLRDKSPDVFYNSTLIIFNNGIELYNKKLITSIKRNTVFLDLAYNEKIYNNIINKPEVAAKRWGPYIYDKLYCFDLLNEFDKVLHLDTDMLIYKDIMPLFYIDKSMAFFTSLSPLTIKKLLNINNNRRDNELCQGGLILYDRKLLSYEITSELLIGIFGKISNNNSLSKEELILSYLIYEKQIDYEILPVDYNCPIHKFDKNNTRILHFVWGTEAKPWKSGIAYASFPEWKKYFEAWIQIGGGGPEFNYNEQNFYNQYYVYKTLKNYTFFSKLINDLKIRTKENIMYDMALNNKFFKFYIKGVPKNIHYEISVDAISRISVGVHCEYAKNLCNELRELFKSLYVLLKTKIKICNYIENNNKIYITIQANLDNVDVLLNDLYSYTNKEIERFFN